jgi:hypothetical protein
MDRLDVAHFRRADDLVDLQIALGPARRTDADCLVGELQVLAAGVRRAIDADRLDAELFASANDPQGDFTAVRNQDSFEHLAGKIRNPKHEIRNKSKALMSECSQGAKLRPFEISCFEFVRISDFVLRA